MDLKDIIIRDNSQYIILQTWVLEKNSLNESQFADFNHLNEMRISIVLGKNKIKYYNHSLEKFVLDFNKWETCPYEYTIKEFFLFRDFKRVK